VEKISCIKEEASNEINQILGFRCIFISGGSMPQSTAC
jgi:hypothetical protein